MNFYKINIQSLCFLIIFTGIAVGCSNNTLATSTATASVNDISWSEVIPIPVEKFYRDQYFHNPGAKPLITLVKYQTPYQGHFDVLQISDDNAFSGWVEVPDWARQSSWTGKISETEKENALGEIDILKIKWPGSNLSGDYMIWFGYVTSSSYELMSCSPKSCPTEICYFFTLADTIVKQQNGTGISCPVLR
jgi:hypothetical protein